MPGADGWESLEVRHLRAFAAVAEHGSFGAAAGALGYTQSAVSQQLQALERIVGGQVLRRHPGGRRPVELTPAGALLLDHARTLLARVQAAQADIEALAGGLTGRITVATIQSIGTRILPDLLARYRAVRPQVDVSIIESASTEDLLGAVEQGAADIGFTALPVRDGPFSVHGLGSDPYVLVTAAGRTERELSDLDGQRLLGIRGCAHDLLIEQRLLAGGLVPATVDRFDDNGMIQALVAAGEGIAVVPALTIDPADPRITVHPVPELPARELVAVTHAERMSGAAAAELIDLAAAPQ